MPKPSLDEAQVDPGFQQMGRVGMTQGMHGDMLLEATLGCGRLNGSLDAATRHWFGPLELFPAGWKEPDRIAVGQPVSTQERQELGSKRDVAVFAALAILDVDLHASTVDLGNAQEDSFVEA
jgi:hypothetical protein